jgi:hypothetical protein
MNKEIKYKEVILNRQHSQPPALKNIYYLFLYSKSILSCSHTGVIYIFRQKSAVSKRVDFSGNLNLKDLHNPIKINHSAVPVSKLALMFYCKRLPKNSEGIWSVASGWNSLERHFIGFHSKLPSHSDVIWKGGGEGGTDTDKLIASCKFFHCDMKKN